MKTIAIYHEHPEWFKPLFTEISGRGLRYIRIDSSRNLFDIEDTEVRYPLFFNRMSPSAYLRDGIQGIFYTLSYLRHLESFGTKTINGFKAFAYDTSKAQQLSLIKKLGYNSPKTRVINDLSQLPIAVKDLRFPILLKANIGGSGAGITKYNSIDSVKTDIANNAIDLGIDKTLLVQEYINSRGGYITRVETLNGKYLYAIKVHTSGETFNLCPADICQTISGKPLVRNACLADTSHNGLKVEAYTPPPEIIQAVELIVQHAGIDVGGVEYLIDDATGEVLFYDINALSNFIPDAVKVIGFNPYEKLVDFLETQLK